MAPTRVIKGSLNRVAGALQPATAVGRFFFGRSLLILAYHTVVGETMDVSDPCFTGEGQFHRELRRLRELGYRFLPLLEAVRRLRDHKLDRPTACISFDDGLSGVYRSAFPILRQLGIPATVFLVTDLVDSADTLWYCRLLDALSRAQPKILAWGGRTYDLSSREARGTASTELQARLKVLKDRELAGELAVICDRLGYQREKPIPETSPFRILGSDQVVEMFRSGLVDFGAHTASHTILTRISKKNAREQILRSLDAVAALTGENCRSFAYPNGKPSDFDEETVEILGSAGVEVAVTTSIGWNAPSTPPLKLRRVAVGEPADDDAFSWSINPIRIILKAVLSSES